MYAEADMYGAFAQSDLRVLTETLTLSQNPHDMPPEFELHEFFAPLGRQSQMYEMIQAQVSDAKRLSLNTSLISQRPGSLAKDQKQIKAMINDRRSGHEQQKPGLVEVVRTSNQRASLSSSRVQGQCSPAIPLPNANLNMLIRQPCIGVSDPNSSRRDQFAFQQDLYATVVEPVTTFSEHYDRSKALDFSSLDLNLTLGVEGKPYSYAQLITYAIAHSPAGKLTLSEIYEWCLEHFPYFKEQTNTGWKNSIRHNLSLNKLFVREPRPINEPGKGAYWCFNEEKLNRGQTLTHSARNRKRSQSALEPLYPVSNMPSTRLRGRARAHSSVSYLPMHDRHVDHPDTMGSTSFTQSALTADSGPLMAQIRPHPIVMDFADDCFDIVTPLTPNTLDWVMDDIDIDRYSGNVMYSAPIFAQPCTDFLGKNEQDFMVQYPDFYEIFNDSLQNTNGMDESFCQFPVSMEAIDQPVESSEPWLQDVAI